MKDSSIESLSSNDNNHNEDGEVVRSTLSDSTLWNLVDDYIKLESGEELLVPKPIRKLIPARIFVQYLKICDETDFKPATERTMLRILEVCPTSTRKSLQGLDNYTGDVSEAFESLEKLSENWLNISCG